MTIRQLTKDGFQGFISIAQAHDNYKIIPNEKGIYLVLSNGIKPQFLETGTGAFYKGRNPNVPVSVLESKIVPDAMVLYIGQAGGGKSKATLRERLKQYLRFGQGHKIGHWGGRYIWQIKGSDELILCWKPLPKDDPRRIEKDTIETFKRHFGCLPFANLRG